LRLGERCRRQRRQPRVPRRKPPVTRQFAQQEVARFQDIGNEVTDFRAVVTDLQGQLDSLQDVGRIEDLATQISDVQRRLEAACAWARGAARTREESVEASFRAYVTRAC
jgi:hypothetical protein